MKAAYEAIGRAVIEAQAFEMILTPAYHIYLSAADASSPVAQDGFIPEKAWRQPVSQLVEALEKKNRFDAAFSQRLRAFAENRNTLVHRWTHTNGWPRDDADASSFAGVVALAHEVEAEARRLSFIFLSYLITHGATSNSTPVHERMQAWTDLFLVANEQFSDAADAAAKKPSGQGGAFPGRPDF